MADQRGNLMSTPILKDFPLRLLLLAITLKPSDQASQIYEEIKAVFSPQSTRLDRQVRLHLYEQTIPQRLTRTQLAQNYRLL